MKRKTPTPAQNRAKEKRWLTSDDPEALLAGFVDATGTRKLRLFSCACCRRAWKFAKDGRLLSLLRTLENAAEGKVKDRSREVARNHSYAVARAEIGDMQQCLAFEIWAALDNEIDLDVGECAAAAFGYVKGSGQRFERGKAAERKEQANVVREIFGNPFRPVAFNPAWRTSDAMLLASGIYDERAFDRMPILADALQEAGCDSDALLKHCRDPHATHVRGCWALDLVLGKQ